MAFHDESYGGGNFVVSFTANPRRDFGVFARGYSRAASMLAQVLLSKPGFPDYEAYPIVFLYRHSLELYLKNLIYKSGLLSAFRRMDDIDGILRPIHRLDTLADIATKVLRTLFPDMDEVQQLARQISNISYEFSQLDPDSYSYRYPTNTRGGAAARRHQTMSLRALSTSMDALLQHMEALDFGLDVETYEAQEIYEILEGMLVEARTGEIAS